MNRQQAGQSLLKAAAAALGLGLVAVGVWLVGSPPLAVALVGLLALHLLLMGRAARQH